MVNDIGLTPIGVVHCAAKQRADVPAGGGPAQIEVFAPYASGRDDVSVGLVIVPQFFGDKVNIHPHLHGLATDGAFDPQGNLDRLQFDMQGFCVRSYRQKCFLVAHGAYQLKRLK